MLELQGSVSVFAGVGLLIIGAVVEGEGEIILVLAHLHHGGIRKREGGVALVRGMVINHHPVHHAVIVLGLGAQHIAVDAVVEGARRDLDLVLGAPDIVPEGIDFIPGDRHEVVAHVEGPDAYHKRGYHQRKHHPRERDSGGLDGHQFVVIPHLAQHHHRRQQGGQRQGQGQDGTSTQKHELQHHSEAEALTHKLVDIHPEELKHQDEYDYHQDRDERSYEGFEYEAVELFQIFSIILSRAAERPAISLPPAVARPGWPPPPPWINLAASRMSAPAFLPASTRSCEYISSS